MYTHRAHLRQGALRPHYYYDLYEERLMLGGWCTVLLGES